MKDAWDSHSKTTKRNYKNMYSLALFAVDKTLSRMSATIGIRQRITLGGARSERGSSLSTARLQYFSLPATMRLMNNSWNKLRRSAVFALVLVHGLNFLVIFM